MPMPKPPLEALRREVEVYLRHKGNFTTAAQACGMARSTLQSHIHLAIRTGILDPTAIQDTRTRKRIPRVQNPIKVLSDEEQLDLAKTRLLERRETVQQRAMLRASQSEISSLEARVKELERERDVLLALESQTRHGGIPHYTSSKGGAIPVFVLSDTHIEERVDPKQIPGCNNEYNPEIARRRITAGFQHALYMTDVMREMAKIDTMCLALTGDLITGDIHEELAETNYMTPIEAVLLGQEILGQGIEYLLSKGSFSKIIIPCAYGNHGRNTDRSRCKDGAEHSYEWLMYNALARSFRGEKRLEWRIASGYHNYIKLWNTTLRFHHGDAIQYGGGVGGITIPIRKAIANWNTVCPADLDVMGHFHQLVDGGDFVVNGSTIGYNEYSLRIKARYERARQAFILIDQKRGKTLTSELFLD